MTREGMNTNELPDPEGGEEFSGTLGLRPELAFTPENVDQMMGGISKSKHAGDDMNPAVSHMERINSFASARIPMSAPQASLATPEIPGYHCHWINDNPGRILKAQKAGYEFVVEEESHVHNKHSYADSSAASGSSDMGTRISAVVGADKWGQVLRAYLMKIRNEWYEQDQAAVQERSDRIQQAMRYGKQVTVDPASAYVKAMKITSDTGRFKQR